MRAFMNISKRGSNAGLLMAFPRLNGAQFRVDMLDAHGTERMPLRTDKDTATLLALNTAGIIGWPVSGHLFVQE